MKWLAVMVAVGLGVMSGCGYATVDRTYDGQLIAAIGAGSNAVARVTATLSPEHLRYTGWTTADERATGYLVRGDFQRLSDETLDRLDAENAAGRRRIDALLHELRERENEIRGAVVSPSGDADLSADARTFVSRWNGFLTSTADGLREVRQAMGETKPMVADMVRLATAAREAKAAGTTPEFATVRRLVMTDLAQRQKRLQRELRVAAKQTPAQRRFGEYVNANHEAQAIVSRVSQRFPHGFFAQLTGASR